MNKLAHLGPLLKELWRFAMQNKAWWIVPTVVVLLLMGFLIATGQVVAPFVYTFF